MATWDVFDSRRQRVRRGLDDDDIRQGLTDGALTDSDFARPSEGGRYRRIREIPHLAHVLRSVGRRPRRPIDPGGGIDLTPMVDVTFLLLLFFMLTASYTMQSTIQVPRPDTPPEGARQAVPTLEDLSDDHVIVTIEADNTILVDDVATPAEGLAEAIRSVREETGRHELILSADPNSYYETLVTVLDAANEAGMQKIQMANPAGQMDVTLR